MRILVSGAAGFLGSHLCRRLVSLGHQVYALDIVHPSEAWRLADVDCTYQWRSVSSADLSVSPDVVIHCASLTSPSFANTSPEFTINQNIVETQRLLESALANLVPRFIHISTFSVYGPSHDQPIKEDVPLHPSNLYGATKASQELLVGSYAYRGLGTTILRMASMYGEAERPDSLVSLFIKRALEGKTIFLDGGGHQRREVNHVSNAINGIILALDDPSTIGGTYNVGSGEEITIRELAEKAVGFAGRSASLDAIGFAPARAGEEGRISLDFREMQKLGYRPYILFEEGFLSTARWVEKHRASQMLAGALG